MFERIHQKLGTAGFIISIVALVAALGGGAYAASGALTGKQKKEVEKIAKKYAGKPGANGATGPAGATGPVGAKGDAGVAGAEGKQGPKGEQGEEGEEGEKGSPWAAGGTLPEGATETGTWSASGLAGAEVYVPIAFSVPLGATITGSKAHLVPEGGEGVCTGTAIAPTAPAGELCVYETEFSGVTSAGIWNTSVLATGAGTTGAFLILEGVTSTSQAYGTWAVTGV